MYHNRNTLILVWSLFLSAVVITFGNGVREIQIKSDPPDGGQTNQICEAGIYTSRQRNIKMVKGVDCYVSFFVQLGAQRFCDIAGDTNLQTNAPVTVARMKITAFRKGKAAWSIITNDRGKYRPGQDVGTNSPNAVVWKVVE